MIKNTICRKIVSILVAINFIGCTSLQPIEAEPNELQDRIRHDNIVNVGDRVKVFTDDGKEYRFQVTAIDAETIRGDDITLLVNSIVALESRGISIGKTTLLTGSVVGIAFLIAIAIAPAAILAASAP
jgi:hypothetical protein